MTEEGNTEKEINDLEELGLQIVKESEDIEAEFNISEQFKNKIKEYKENN